MSMTHRNYNGKAIKKDWLRMNKSLFNQSSKCYYTLLGLRDVSLDNKPKTAIVIKKHAVA